MKVILDGVQLILYKTKQMKEIDINRIQTGDILLYKNKGFLPRAIRWFTRTDVNHVSIAVEMWGEMFVFESIGKGFVPQRIEDSIRGADITVMKPNYRIDERQISLLTASMSGHHRYDFFALLVHQPIYTITKRLFGKGKWIGRRDEKAIKRLYCSEAIAYIYNYFTPSIMKQWWKYYPGMFLKEEEFTFFKLEQ